MFNPCRRWRVLLARRAEGALSMSQWGTLQRHLVSCSACRQLAEADTALQDVLGLHTPALSHEAGKAFDNRVVTTLAAGNWNRSSQTSWLSRLWGQWAWVQTRCRALPVEFMAQIGGGAALAVTLTSFFLVPTLHSTAPHAARNSRLSDRLAHQTAEGSEAPVTMESLLRTPTPRAALLWTTPGTSRERLEITRPGRAETPSRILSPAPVKVKPSSPATHGQNTERAKQHSALPINTAVG